MSLYSTTHVHCSRKLHLLQLALSLVVDLGERNEKNKPPYCGPYTLGSFSFKSHLTLSSHITPLCLSSGAFAALSNFRRLPCNSISCRFLIALCAVSWSWYSQKANPFDLPVCWSYTILRRLHNNRRINTYTARSRLKNSPK